MTRRRSLSMALGALALAAAAPASAGAQRLVTWTVPSRYVDVSTAAVNPGVRSLKVNVLLPNGYDGRRRFPLLVLLHGHGDLYSGWAAPTAGDVRRVARGLPAIVAMPEGGRGWYANWWRGGARGDPAWERYHLDELVPALERRLRIRRGRRWHAIAGLSMGGEGAAYYASQRPGYFGSVAAFSGPLHIERSEWPVLFDTQGEKHTDVFGDPVRQAFYWRGHDPTALVRNLRWTRTFVRCGDGTPAPDPAERRNTFGQAAERVLRLQAQDFVAAARRTGVPVTYQPHRGIHAWRYWRADLAAAVRWGLFRPVAEHPRNWSLATVSRSGRAWDVAFSFSRPPRGLVTFRRAGRRLSATGAGLVSVGVGPGRVRRLRLPFSRVLWR